ncbi:hypothetical protein B0T19DRAFT_477709 [Cercophora scortea]|uniref:Uncharacterized protein n=1 Tax=Cercophora scortea TaxID=314031 RepID=A0AAE0I8G4_9PEZI|nr:hypothetical protein B0T19DRAFT_477709 [Cercophora scortea]
MSLLQRALCILLVSLSGLQGHARATPIVPSPESGLSRRFTTYPCSENTVLKDLWSIEGVKVTYASFDEAITKTNASFTFTNTRTNYTETIKCSPRVNSICDILGTPGDPQTDVYLQILMDVAYITITQPVSCSGGSTNTSTVVVGTTEIDLNCPTGADHLSCFSDSTPGLADGTITVTHSAPATRALHRRAPAIYRTGEA